MSEAQFRVNFKRLKTDIKNLAKIGLTEGLGISRTAFSDADMQARAWLKSQIEKAGLDFYQDGAANIHGKLHCEGQLPSIMTGSHIDTVPGAGHLDGALGVICGLEALRVLKENNAELVYPLELVAFSDEEGAFSGMFGSQALTGDISAQWIHSAKNLDGLTLIEAMRQHGLNAMDALSAKRSPNSIKAFIELHIEQGPVLDTKQIPIGVVEGICGLQRWDISLVGLANHAGTTPMDLRHDAFQGVTEFAGKIEQVLTEQGSSLSVATIGRIELLPGAANVIPGEARFSLEFRDVDKNKLQQLAEAFRTTLSAIAESRGLALEISLSSNIVPVACNETIQNLIAQTASRFNLPVYRMPSGAAHDTQKLAQITAAGMIFVPSKAGRSHCAAEWTSWDDIEAGANVLLNSLYQLASRTEA